MIKRLFTKNRILFLLGGISFLLFSSCNGKKAVDDAEDKNVRRDTVVIVPEKIPEPRLVINYFVDSLATTEELDSLYTRFSEEEQRFIFALNRIEKVRVGVGTKLIIPDTLITDVIKYSPFPENLSLLDSIPKSVIISQRVQAFGLYENGNLIKWGPVSSGKLSTPTPNGLHYGNYKAKRKISTVNSDWILPYYFNFMNFEGVGVHQYLLPGFPASHACVRLDMEDAKYIYDWAEQWKLDKAGNIVVRNGTPFMVFGEYNYDDEAPWFSLFTDPDSNHLTEAEMDTIKDYVKRYMEDERNFIQEEEDIEEVLVVR